mmetsp:Transcript_12717/g.38345  ORF Transcript_12717/g.38345 Transcript_12717/m.38345 type:complete len:199 (+) Transcript_12717:247-843(+)
MLAGAAVSALRARSLLQVASPLAACTAAATWTAGQQVQWSAVQDIRGGAGMRRGIADAVERDVTDSVVATPSGETFVPVITEEEEPRAALTPREVVEILDRNIVGQTDAKKAVANALRNRWRRQRIESPMKEEIVPKNILMVGPTGCGKTEIARRLAKLMDAPFVMISFTVSLNADRDFRSMILMYCICLPVAVGLTT